MLFKEQLLMTDFFLDRTADWQSSQLTTGNHAKSCGSMTTLNTIKEDVEALEDNTV